MKHANTEPTLFEMRTAWVRENQRQQSRKATCSGCGASLVWIQMATRKDGKPGGRMPCDAQWQYGDGRRSLVVTDDRELGHLLARASPEVLGREPHFATCPVRDHFKRKKP